MNKSELIDKIAVGADLPKAVATRALETTLEAITGALKEGEQVAILGFGAFTVRNRPARDGRNPRTGDIIKIKATNVANFKPGKALKDIINGEQK